MMDKITQYRTKLTWIKQLLSMNESQELNKIWKKYAMLRRIIDSIDLNLNELQILESNVNGLKKKNYKIRAKKVAKELKRLTELNK